MSNSRFALDRKEAGDQLIRHNEKMQGIQSDTMQNMLAAITGQFFQQFGFEGRFELKEFMTDRSSVKIMAADQRTAGALKSSPGWLSQYLDNIVI